MDRYITWTNGFGNEVIASEACGGVVESEKTRNRTTYLPTTLVKYVERLKQNTPFFKISEE
jgi:hypothetical protein